MIPEKGVYPAWHYGLVADLQNGVRMAACEEKYGVDDSVILSIFYNVMRESRGLPPLSQESKKLEFSRKLNVSVEEDDDELDLTKSE